MRQDYFALAHQLAQLRADFEAAGWPIESVTIIDDDVRPASRVVRRPRAPHTTPLLDETDHAA